MGVINLLSGPYVIVVSERRRVGELFGEAIWHVEEVQLLPCAPTAALPPIQVLE